MQLIQLQKNLLVNPDKISSVEVKKRGDHEMVIVTVEGRAITLESGFDAFFNELKKSGMQFNKQFWSI